MSLKKLFIFVALMMAATTLYAQTAEEIIQKHLEKRGNVEFGELKSMMMKGEITMPQSPMGSIQITYYMQNGQMRSEQEIQGKKIVIIYDGSKMYVKNELAGDIAFKPAPAEATPDQLSQYNEFIMGPFSEIDESTEFVYIGKVEEDGEKMHKIQIKDPEMASAENPTVAYIYIDPVSYLVDHYRIEQKVEGKEHTQVIKFEDRAKVKGVIYPQYIEILADGQTQSEIEITEVTINEAVDEMLFIPQ
ncbi:MAG: LolA family protein [Candidatus Kapaibacterium sp.]